jgi:glycosyltransferase involved in cell wall biosynthesis
MKKENSLTIAIPTFNRPIHLKKTLGIILPQINNHENVFLRIQDNYSEIPAKVVYEALSYPIPTNRILITRNNLNIGANANIMRCFENCNTKWLWVLSDDDQPSDSAVDIILKDVKFGHCFAYYSVPRIKKPQFGKHSSNNLVGSGFESLVSHFGHKNKLEIGFLSAAIFNMDIIRPYIIDGHLTASTGLPHILMTLKAITNGHNWMISKDVIADYCPPIEGEGWGFMSFAYAMIGFLGVASKQSEIISIRNILIKGWRPSPKKVLYSQVTTYLPDGISSRDLRYLFNTVKNIFAPSWKEDPLLRLRWNITSIWAHFPKIFVAKYKSRKEGKARINLVNHDRR